MTISSSKVSSRSLLDSIQHDDIETVRKYLDEGADPNVQGAAGWTPLFLARNAVRADMLLAAGADPNAKANDGETPLHQAALNGNANLIEAMLAGGADPNAKDNKGCTPLILAAFNDEKGSKVICLLKNGADPNLQDVDGQTPLHGAALKGPGENVLALLQAGANPLARNQRGETPLDLAEINGYPATLAALRRAALDVKLDTAPSAFPHHSSPSTPPMVIGGAVWNARDEVQTQPAAVQEAPRQRLRL